MGFFSFNFLLFLSALILAFRWCAGGRSRRLVLTGANALFLLSFGLSWSSLAALGLLLAAGFLLLRLVADWGRPWLLAASVAAVAVALVIVKRYWFLRFVLPQSVLASGLEIVGLSYIAFKLIHMLVDRAQGVLAPFTLLSYVNYQLGFVSLVAGPIQRYNEFHGFWQSLDEPAGHTSSEVIVWNRMLNGMIELGLLATAAVWLFDKFEVQAREGRAVGLLGMFYAYPAYVYWNFAGYCDIVIAAAALIGLRQPENFNRPYLARNLIDFWNRWHITLTRWIRDYVFMASLKSFAARWPAHAGAIGYGLLFLALFLAGVWHGPGWNFVVFGSLHGIGVVACQIYTDALRRRLGRKGVERYLSRPWLRVAASAITIHYVCLMFLFFRPATITMLAGFMGVRP